MRGKCNPTREYLCYNASSVIRNCTKPGNDMHNLSMMDAREIHRVLVSIDR